MPDIQQLRECEICILAGGLSQRMGRDKARLRFGKKRLLDHVLDAACATGYPVRVIRRDNVPRCGPLGGVLTGLTRARSDFVLFLACDMPMVGDELLHWLIEKSSRASAGLFVRFRREIGFPFLLPRQVAAIVTNQIERKDFSLHALARILHSRILTVPRRFARELRNLNTPEDLVELTQLSPRRMGRPRFRSNRSPSTKM